MDPVGVYVREMGTGPRLPGEGEVERAKRNERGQNRVLKAISRSPIVINEIIALGEDLKKGVRSIKEIVPFDEEEVTDEIVAKRLKDTVTRIDNLTKHYRKPQQLTEKLLAIPEKKKQREHRRCRSALDRQIVEISKVIRAVRFLNPKRKRLIDRVNKTVDSMRQLDRQIQSLEKKHEATRSEELKKEYRKNQRQ